MDDCLSGHKQGAGGGVITSKIVAYSPLLSWKAVFIGILTSFLFLPTPIYDLSG